MPTIIKVPTAINFLENSHSYAKQDAYTYSELNSIEFCPVSQFKMVMGAVDKASSALCSRSNLETIEETQYFTDIFEANQVTEIFNSIYQKYLLVLACKSALWFESSKSVLKSNSFMFLLELEAKSSFSNSTHHVINHHQ